MKHIGDTIAAIATAQGGAIAIIRLSGRDAVAITDRVFRARGGKALREAAGYTVHFGEVVASGTSDASVTSAGEVVDEVLVTVFRAPHSYTGEDSVEISYHGSPYIGRRIMELLIEGGARAAEAGEFTVRAFLAGKMDLSAAEAVADLIASSDRAQHALALDQMRGSYSSQLASLRGELVRLASLLELELDFSDEDVEFAERGELLALAERIAAEIERLAGSFSLGNVIKEGVPVAIVGRPNAGKSTLLNALVRDDRAIVSEIEGTTRDRIEERVALGGVSYRFIDTAGLRTTTDRLEQMGIERARDAVRGARLVLLVTDASTSAADILAQAGELGLTADQRLCVVLNKIDRLSEGEVSGLKSELEGSLAAGAFGGSLAAEALEGSVAVVALSAKTGLHLDALEDWLRGSVDTGALYSGAVVVSNARHYEALQRAGEGIARVRAGLSTGLSSDGLSTGLSSDLLAEDVREVLYHLGTITGEVTSSEILATIFSKFCIGK
ncbi:MAG: tRNA uridine-5-carboxymethylaminomethyl(34) synthesis GTPase MnmE [Rikenellaceae bacterium]|jgi:tRNA modification GTPase|nr:tRNA uridine-5-carboxymethylaminomethyl(34) synthesis GTPase MnmE [Rikenellaceae bacterium]